MKFIQTHGMGGDCTASYDVKYYNEIVADFVGEVLNKYKSEWGYFEIDGHLFEYRYGKLLDEMPSNILSKRIASVKESGGYLRMDYYIKTTMNHTEQDEEQETIIMSPYEAEFCEAFYGKPLNYYCPEDWKIIKEDYAKLKEIVKREFAEERYKS